MPLIVPENRPVNNSPEKNTDDLYWKTRALISCVADHLGKGTQSLLEWLGAMTYHHGEAKVSQDYLAIKSQCSKRNAQRKLKILEALNIIEVQRGWDGPKKRSINTYRVNFVVLFTVAMDIKDSIASTLQKIREGLKKKLKTIPEKIILWTRWTPPETGPKIELGESLSKQEIEKGIGDILANLMQREKRQDVIEKESIINKETKTSFKRLNFASVFT